MINKLIMKVSGACNLSCSYCYYMKDRTSSQKVLMSVDTVRSCLNKFAQYLSLETNRIYDPIVYWHGGEPLIQPISFWDSVIEIQSELSYRFGLVWQNGITTNGTIVKPEHVQFLKSHNWSVALSLDSSKSAHDKLRVYSNGDGSYDRALAGLKLLQGAGVKVRVLSVLQPKKGAGQEAYNHLTEIGAEEADLLLPLTNWTERQSKLIDVNRLLLNEIFAFMTLWLSDGRTFEVRLFDSMFRKVLFGKPGLCHHEDKCHEVVTIEPDGSIHICDDLVSVKGQSTLLSSQEPDSGCFSDNFESAEYALHGLIESRGYYSKADECINCDVYDICNGGCPANRWDGTSYRNKSVHCDIYKGLFGMATKAFGAGNIE